MQLRQMNNVEYYENIFVDFMYIKFFSMQKFGV